VKKLFSLSVSILIITSAFAQSANVTWGDEFKLKKGSTDLEVIHADNTGVYVKNRIARSKLILSLQLLRANRRI